MQEDIKVYSPESEMLKPKNMFSNMLKDVSAGKDLALRLAKRDIKAQYRQSFLGIIWAILIPLANTVIWIFLQGSGIIKVSDTGLPYAIYVFTGTMLWQVFVESIQAPITEMNMAKNLLSKLNFPREAILLSGIYKILFNSAIKLVLIVIGILVMGVTPSLSFIVFPIIILMIILVGFTIGLFLTPIGTLYTDIGRAIPIGAQLLMFFSPVVFAIPTEGVTSLIFKYNFMTPLLMTARNSIKGDVFEFVGPLSWVLGISMVIFFISWLIFRVTIPVLVERMNA